MENDGFTEPSPRWGHCSAAVERQIYVYGGRTKDFLRERATLASQIHLFDPYLESWTKVDTLGSLPPGVHSSACASVGRCIYIYGGADGEKFYNTFHQLDTTTLTWKSLGVPKVDCPMSKDACSMVSHGNELVLFGGYGIPSASIQPKSKFREGGSFAGGGWSNELHAYNLESGTLLESCKTLYIYIYIYIYIYNIIIYINVPCPQRHGHLLLSLGQDHLQCIFSP